MLCLFYYGKYQLFFLWLPTNSNALREILAVIVSVVLYLLYLSLNKMTILRERRHCDALISDSIMIMALKSVEYINGHIVYVANSDCCQEVCASYKTGKGLGAVLCCQYPKFP